jgi:hypothetical protein
MHILVLLGLPISKHNIRCLVGSHPPGKVLSKFVTEIIVPHLKFITTET